MNVPEIHPDEAVLMLQQGSALFVDIRDPASHEAARIRGARPLRQEHLDAFLADIPHDQPLVVCCYHGNSSRDATRFLLEQGYAQVASLQGGFESWRQRYPEHCEPHA